MPTRALGGRTGQGKLTNEMAKGTDESCYWQRGNVFGAAISWLSWGNTNFSVIFLTYCVVLGFSGGDSRMKSSKIIVGEQLAQTPTLLAHLFLRHPWRVVPSVLDDAYQY